MPASALTGSRIREHRQARKMRQADLARDAGISASYLNLIEHNRRRIAGKVLADIARVLDVDAASLTQGAEDALVDGLRAAAAGVSDLDVSAEVAEDIARRHPDWARLMVQQTLRISQLEHTVSTLTDRLAHDPFLTQALHDVISSVTSIRSSSSILIGENDIEPDWQQRFQQNIFNDSRRLAESAQSLATYLDGATGETVSAGTPRDDSFAALEAAGHYFEALEDDAADDATVARIVQDAALSTDAARALLHNDLLRYLAIARAVPLAHLPKDITKVIADPVGYAQAIGQPLTFVLQRLAMLPEPRSGAAVGMVRCDAAGALIARKPIKGFDIPRVGASCPLWPLYAIWGRPHSPMRNVIRQEGQGKPRLVAYTAAEEVISASFEQSASYEAVMIVVDADAAGVAEGQVQSVGSTCRVCSVAGCAARREPSVLGDPSA